MPGTKKPNRKPKKKRPPQEGSGHSGPSGAPGGKGGKGGFGPGVGASGHSPTRTTRGAARGG